MKIFNMWYDSGVVGENMNQLESARNKIDAIDKQMADLYEQRMDAVKDVIQYKMENDLPVYDGSREERILLRNSGYIKNPDYAPYYVDFMKAVMNNSKDFQRSLQAQDIVAYCGIKGSFSYMTSEKLFPGNPKMALSSFEDVFEAVVEKRAQYGVIPFENTNSGLVGEVLDALSKYPVYIIQTTHQKIEQCLLGLPQATLKDVEWVYSKDQALSQTKVFLQELGVQTVAYPNTAMAAQYVAGQKDIHKAAIGAKENAALYGLKVLASKIEENVQNTTKFLVIGLEPSLKGERFSLCIVTKHEAGSLAKIINAFGRYGLNMQEIQSRPIKGRPFEYFFYIESDGNLEDANVKDCLKSIEEVSESIKILGNYILKEEE